MIKENNFTEGKILPPMLKFAVPVLFALILQATYGAADLLIVGQFGSAADVSAVSTGSMVLQTITGLITGLTMGTTIFLGQKIGEGDQGKAGSIVEASIHLFIIVALILTAVFTVFSSQISTLLNAPQEAFSSTVQYITICSSGMVFIVAYNVMSGIMRGLGNSKMPLITVGIASAVNIIGDLILVGCFNMAASGAAIATVFAQAVSVVASVFIIKKKGLPFKVRPQKISRYKKEIAHILKLGSPVALQSLLVSISFLAIGAIVNALGVIASAGVGVAEKLCQFIMLVPESFMQSLSTITAQNEGAAKHQRSKKVLLCGMVSSLVIGVFMAYLSFFHGDMLSAIFTTDPQVIAAAASYLKAYAIDAILVSFLFCFVGYFNGCGRTTFVMIQGIIGAFCVRIPVAFFMSRLADVTLFKVGLSTPASTVVQIILCSAAFFVIEKNIGKKSAKL